MGSEAEEMKQMKSSSGSKRAAAKRSKWLIMLLTGTMLMSPFFGMGHVVHADGKLLSASETRAATGLVKVGEEIITSGAKLLKYQYTTTRSGKQVKANLNMVQADLQNPYLKLDTMTGTGGKLNARQSVGGMAKETGAVAAVNGDYFAMDKEGAPLGPEISGGTVISSPSALKGMYAFGVTKSNQPVIDEYRFQGKVTSEDGSSFELAGINQSAYMTEPDKQYSHVNAMYIYTSSWKNQDRPINSSTTPTEVLVRNGVVEEFSDKASIKASAPEEGYILRGHGTAASYMREHMQVGMQVSTDYRLVSQTSGKLVDPDSFQMMIGGHTLLVENGKASGFTRDTNSISGSSARARTAVGYSKDGRYAYIITVEKNDYSAGLTLKEMQQALVQAGVWKAVNLDGGGSTTMVHRPLAETSNVLSFNTEYGTTQRQVVNGLGVYTTAPQGAVKGMVLSGSTKLYIGQQATYSTKAYDEYYNPVDAGNVNMSWSASNDVLAWNGSSFVAKRAGSSQVIGKSGSATAKKEVEVIGASQIDQLYMNASSAPLTAGASVKLQVKVKLKDGSVGTLPNESVKWELKGFEGSVKDGTLTVNSVPAGASIGYAFASYDGLRTMIPLTVSSEQLVEDFNGTGTTVGFTSLPKDVTKGQAAIVGNYDGKTAQDKVVKLNYDMTAGSDNKFAYALFNNGKGIPMGGLPTSVKLDIYGDNSLNWLRAEFIDANGKSHVTDVAKYIDWSGWKTLEMDTSSLGATGSLSLKRLYVVNLKDGQDERAAKGEVAFDRIRATMPAGGAANLPKADMKLTVNSRAAVVNGKEKRLDVAPIVLNGSTYVPVRVILDAFGGETAWNGQQKKVTVLRGDRYLELTVNAKEYLNNGKRVASDVAPIIRSNRTLVPLRLVSEQIGLIVNWDQKTKSITIR
ncbi:stalk domain-containing protein [Paenibacillus aquistagni]|uniref:Copper amine oxidase N-terminal domain-containing protein n=1 Tax=Paenibacillus aquistagni TaxID=1852522 RepID=A0A1X7KW78_9BACL|nr:stalk domain-containing protein [Paenibacillus aquistagni]SMG45868.1 Copper amine oxidase N-terminal domain-containing protein [Paenibacillus aquistagni]